ncbi:DUF1275 family protein [Rhodococcus sp. PAMC28707]|uniref:YoaK family protein n=1 Tax=Rhodococcus sp. PAMC28707 TaxID=2565560 RepID=UPI0032B36947
MIEILVIATIGFLPDTVPNSFVTVPISFVAAVQVTTFRALVDSAYNTTMTTGNLRSLSQALFHRIANGNKAAGTRAINFGSVILGFVAGAILGAGMSEVLENRAVWVAAAMLVVALLLFVIDERVEHPR